MKETKKPDQFSLKTFVSLLFVGSLFLFSTTAFGALLPKGLIMKEAFKPGLGQPIGQVVLVQGKVVLIHAKEKHGYRAMKDLPLFKGDVIITMKKGRIRFKLNDESLLTLASRTKLTLSRSVYDTKKKERSSFFKMAFGKARFFVKKMLAFRRSEFKVKTPTAVMGVRGSDFITRVWKIGDEKIVERGVQVADASDSSFLYMAQLEPKVPYVTEVTALKDTVMDVVSLAAPEVPPTVLKDFEQTTIKEGALPTVPLIQTPQAIERLMKDFVVKPELVVPEVKPDVVGKKEEKKEPAPKPEVTVEKPVIPMEEKGVRVSDDQLVKPEDITGPKETREPLVPVLPARESIIQTEKEAAEQQEKIIEEKFEETVPTTPKILPRFPEPPRESMQTVE